MTAHLMDKGLDACLKPGFDNKLPAKQSSPRDNDEKGAAELNKKTMCQFIQAFTNISLLNKVNLTMSPATIGTELPNYFLITS